jgi:predicted acyltransferase
METELTNLYVFKTLTYLFILLIACSKLGSSLICLTVRANFNLYGAYLEDKIFSSFPLYFFCCLTLCFVHKKISKKKKERKKETIDERNATLHVTLMNFFCCVNTFNKGTRYESVEQHFSNFGFQIPA